MIGVVTALIAYTIDNPIDRNLVSFVSYGDAIDIVDFAETDNGQILYELDQGDFIHAAYVEITPIFTPTTVHLN